MKTIKYIWLAILGISLLSFTVKAQENNSYDKTVSTVSKGVSTAYDDLKQTAPKIEKALTSLGKELKVGVNAVWDILVRQQLVYALAILLGLILTIISWFHFWYRLKIFHDKGGREMYIFPCVLTCILALAGTIVSAIHFNDMLTGFINPEFGAMKTIAEIASQIK